MPGDPRLPRTAPDGTSWPPEAGALRVKARYLLATKDGREAYEVAKAFGAEQGFSIGYRVRHARKVGRVRHIDDLDLYEFSPVLHGANRLARLVSIKGGPPPRLETKATTGVLPARRRVGMPVASACSVCGRPAAAIVPGGLRAGETLICPRCVEVAEIDSDTAVLDADDIAAAYRLTNVERTAEEEYDAALDAEVEWHLESDGTLARGSRDPWDRNRGAPKTVRSAHR